MTVATMANVTAEAMQRALVLGSGQPTYVEEYLDRAHRAASAAFRAKPANGMGVRRRQQAVEAMALLLLALEGIDQ